MAATEAGGLEPRLGLVGDVLDELRWTFGSRKGWLLGILSNLVFAYAYLAITQGDPRQIGDIKAANVGLAVVVWCLADPINTNQLGSDSDRAAASLERGDSVARILAIKNLALALLLVPLAFLISIIHRAWVDHWRLLLHTAVFDAGAVFLWLGVGCVVSVLLPYRPISLRARLRARSTWLRWGLCQAATYAALAVVAPIHLIYLLVYGLRVFGPLTPNFIYYALVYLGVGVGTWLVGLGLAAVYGRRAKARLIFDLQRAG